MPVNTVKQRWIPALRTIGLCFRAQIGRPGKIIKGLWIPAAFATVIFSMMVLMSLALHLELNPDKEGQYQVTSGRFAQVLSAQVIQWAQTSGTEEGVPVWVESVSALPPAFPAALKEQGFRLTSNSASPVRLRLKQDRWVLQSDQPGLAVVLWPRVSSAIQAAYLANHLPAHFTDLTAGQQRDKKIKQAEHYQQWTLANAIAFAFVLPLVGALGLVFLGSAAEIESERREGCLEPWALSSGRFACYMWARCLAQGVQYMAVVGAVLVTASLLVTPMHLLTALWLVLAGGSMAMAMTALGMASVLSWHHRWSKSLGVVVVLPAVVVLGCMWGLEMLGDHGAPQALKGMRFLHTPPLAAFGFFCATGPLAWAMTGAVCRFVEWRLGPFRAGLARL